ncbi:MAG: 1-(5-phosphoribosyl)-5-[(5-phosphoribosylamino)methylideneamino]imidazole-4-carboxamide isomerase [Clostridiales bacterium]|nr:1-(5-phosphoribosyl)-5-[(5-phosphoribosylamino)methylideneamino]imidazole-4-carboxamide isomerase [Clostridiales bacterium]
MLIIPAIDLLGGQAVRLYKGDFAQKTVYSADPATLAEGFAGMGAQYLHIVDLDGAKGGGSVNDPTIAAIRARIDIPIQVGGGIRNAETVAHYLNALGVNRVILGTAAVENPTFAREMIKTYGPERIVIGVDVREGKVSTSGWLQDSGVDYLDFIGDLIGMGARYIVATDILRDGTLTAPNWAMYEKISGINVIVSGGVSCEEDIKKARAWYGVIVGKAYYEGKVDLRKCLQNELSPV